MSSSDTWNQLQAHKRKHESLKERLAKRRKERQGFTGIPQDEKPAESTLGIILFYFHIV